MCSKKELKYVPRKNKSAISVLVCPYTFYSPSYRQTLPLMFTILSLAKTEANTNGNGGEYYLLYDTFLISRAYGKEPNSSLLLQAVIQKSKRKLIVSATKNP